MSEKRTTKKGAKAHVKAPKASAGSPIDFGLLAQIVELMSANDLNTVDVRDGDRRVILKRGAAGAAMQLVPASAPAPAPAHSPTSVPAAAPAAPVDDESKFHRITSPMVGTFYASPKPGEKPFVSVGSTVDEDADVCIIEAMKTFNNIKAECSGVIVRSLVQDGQPVEFGTTLFLVKPN